MKTELLTREEWLEARRSGIGASEAPILFGLGYGGQSPMSVYASKVGAGAAERVSDSAERRLARGRMLETSIGEIVAAETGYRVLPNTGYRINKGPGHAFATVDADVYDGARAGILECKAVSHYGGRREWEDGKIPDRVSIQVQQQLLCTPDASFALVFPLIDSLDGEIIRVESHEALQGIIIQEIESFWEQFVSPRREPPADYRPATAQALARLHPQDDGTACRLPDDLRPVIERLEADKQLAKEIETSIKAAENKIKAALGDHSYGVCGDKVYSWKTQTRNEKPRPARSYDIRVLRAAKKLPKGVNVDE